MKLLPLSAFAAIILIIAQNFQIASLCFHAPQCILYRAVPQISLEVHEETVFPGFSRDGTGFDLSHVQPVVDNVGKHVVKGSAFMRQLKTDADLSGFFLVLRLPAYNDEACGVCFFPADMIQFLY